ncbi:hypothetical protein E2C01_089892 [Portunus trituberculatus]|uniref:Uncharacterized protein n=1 Tax=Portunus trituberculatus TaxID=210409 RepID=A0A5B7JET2_PORTR|nr:hypothetical protein [Portunus trituberculatus]
MHEYNSAKAARYTPEFEAISAHSVAVGLTSPPSNMSLQWWSPATSGAATQPPLTFLCPRVTPEAPPFARSR